MISLPTISPPSDTGVRTSTVTMIIITMMVIKMMMVTVKNIMKMMMTLPSKLSLLQSRCTHEQRSLFHLTLSSSSGQINQKWQKKMDGYDFDILRALGAISLVVAIDCPGFQTERELIFGDNCAF